MRGVVVILVQVVALVGRTLGEVEYATEPDLQDDEQKKTVDRDKDSKSGPTYMDYAPHCYIHPNYACKCFTEIQRLNTKMCSLQLSPIFETPQE